jgi:hypothetical protein
MGYGAMVTLHGVMGYGAMVLHDAENCNKIMAPCNHGALAYGAMQYNYGALELGVVQKGQIVKFLQIRFILCSNFRKRVNLSHFDKKLARQPFKDCRTTEFSVS